MSTRMMCAIASLLVPMFAVAAKPPDLPVDIKVVCQPEALENVAGHAQLVCRPAPEDGQAPVEVCPCLDASCAQFCELMCQFFQAVAGVEESSLETEQIDAIPAEVRPLWHTETLLVMPREVKTSPRRPELRQLLRVAERCWRDGDLAMCGNCYHEIIRLARRGPLARHAEGRLAAIKRIQDDAAAAEQECGAVADQQFLEQFLQKVQQLRQQGQESSACPCPFRRDSSAENQASPGKPLTGDDLELQDMLDATVPLEIYLDQTNWEAQTLRSSKTDDLSARVLFRIGQRCRRAGDLDMALSCYVEANRIAPKSRCGRHAWREMQAIQRTLQPALDELVEALTEARARSNHKKDVRTSKFYDNVEVYHAPADRIDVQMEPAAKPAGEEASEPAEITVAPMPRELEIVEDAEPSVGDQAGSAARELLSAVRSLLGPACVEVEINADGWRTRGTIYLGSFSCRIVKDKLGAVQVVFPEVAKP
jgi:hypothetical protein